MDLKLGISVRIVEQLYSVSKLLPLHDLVSVTTNSYIDHILAGKISTFSSNIGFLNVPFTLKLCFELYQNTFI